MTNEERTQHENALRVALNTIQLLQIGQFPGKYAVTVQEGVNLVNGMAEELKKALAVPSIILPGAVETVPASALPQP